MARRACLVLVVAGLVPALAHADSWSWDDDASELEVRHFVKSMTVGLRVPRALVDATEVPEYGGLELLSTRIWGRLVLDQRLELQLGWQLDALVPSDRSFATAAVAGGSPQPASAPRARRRLVDFDPVLARHDGATLSHDLGLLAVRLDTAHADLVVGRQVLSWGSGRLWNPTDLLSPFAPTDVDREVRRGVDAVRVSIPLAATSQLELLWLPLPAARDQGGVARLQTNLLGFDVAPSVAKYVRDVVLGLDATGDLGRFGVHGEAAWTIALDRDADGQREDFVRAVVGGDVRPVDELAITAEYYFNGWGAADPSGYLGVLSSARVTRGEVFGAGRHYLGVAGSWRASELLTVNASTIVNLGDPSVIVVPSLEYWAQQDVLLRAGAYLPLGRQPGPGATGGLTLRSEYGVAPLGLFAQVAIYLL
jgi:hypothetical protein